MAKTITEIRQKASTAPGFQQVFPDLFPLGLAADGSRAAECFKKVTIRRLPRKLR
jgi:hypothetical protein